MSTLQLRQERHAIAEEMRRCLTGDSPDVSVRWRELDAKQEALRLKIEQSEKTGQLNHEMNATDRRSFQLPPITDHNGYAQEAEHGELSPADQARSTPEYARAFETLVRTGKESYETRALSSTGDGQTLIPLGFQNDLEVKLKAFSGMRQACRILKTATGGPLTWPTVDDTGVLGAIIAESASVTTADPTFSSVTLGSSLISSKEVIVPIQVLQDSAINIESYLADAFATRIGRAMELNYTTGASTIAGLIPALVAATGRSVTAVGANANSGNVGDTTINSVGTTDLGNLVNALDPAYTQNGSFMANASVWNKLRSQLDKYGRPIWQVSVAGGEPDTCWGKPFYYNMQMANIGINAVSMIFGDFSKYIIRDSLGVTFVILREKYIEQHQIAFLGFARTDGKLLQPSAFVMLTHPAS